MSSALETTDARLARLYQSRHRWFTNVVEPLANSPTAYGNGGQWAFLMWKATGLQSWFDAFVNLWMTSANYGLPYDPVGGRNTTRERGWWNAWLYGQVRDQLTDAQRAECVRRLYHWADLMLGLVPTVNWGTHITDSDEVVGHLMALAGIAKSTALDSPRAAMLMQEVGGKGPNGLLSASVPQMRAALTRFCQLAHDGEWFESSEYNPGTTMLHLCGAAAVGFDVFPESLPFAHVFAKQILWEMTPDYKDRVQWGDDERPHQMQLHDLVGSAAIVAGITGDSDGRIRAHIGRLTGNLSPYPNYWNNLYRALLFYDPEPQTTTPDDAYGVRYADLGLTIFRSPTELIQHMGFRPTGVDHEPSIPLHDLRWYRNGKWVLDHPIIYAGTQAAHNTALLSNLWKTPLDRGPAAISQPVGAGFQAKTSARGTLADLSLYQPPRPFLTGWDCTVTYDGVNTLTVEDRFDASKDPLSPDMLIDRYSIVYPPGLAAHARARFALWVRQFHCPVMPRAIANGFEWEVDGITVRVTCSGHTKLQALPVSRADIGGQNVTASEVDGWVIQFGADTLQATLTSTFAVLDVPSPPSGPVTREEFAALAARVDGLARFVGFESARAEG